VVAPLGRLRPRCYKTHARPPLPSSDPLRHEHTSPAAAAKTRLRQPTRCRTGSAFSTPAHRRGRARVSHRRDGSPRTRNSCRHRLSRRRKRAHAPPPGLLPSLRRPFCSRRHETRFRLAHRSLRLRRRTTQERDSPLRRLRRARTAVWHQCKDVDLALWVSDFTRQCEIKRNVADTTNACQAIAAAENLPDIPHHAVDDSLPEPGTDRCRGNLCIFGQCPKKGKPECAVAGCGAQPFLRLYEDFRFDRTAPLRDPAVVLFDRAPAAPQRLTKRRFATHRLSRRARLFAISPNHELIFRPTVFK